MPYTPQPPEPARGGAWIDLARSQYALLRSLITDVPALRDTADTTAAAVASLTATRAPIASPTFTGTVTGVTKGMVGLGNVDNTSDTAKRYSATQITSGTFTPERLPSQVVAIRRRTPQAESAPTATNWEPRPAGWATVINVGAAPPPADASPNDLHVPGAPVAAPAGTTFSGVNGSPWPAPWVAAQTPSGGSIALRDGMGLLSTGTTTGNYDGVDSVAVRHSAQAADVTVEFMLRRLTSSVWPRFVARSDREDLDPGNGITILLAGTGVSITQVSSWTYTRLAETTFTWEGGVDYVARIQLQGGAVRVRVWRSTAPEPTTWTLTATTTHTASGWWGFVAGTGATTDSQTVALDNIIITS